MKIIFGVFLILFGAILVSIKFDDLGFTTNIFINFLGFVSMLFGVNKVIKKRNRLI